jgi:hypothetical protein
MPGSLVTGRFAARTGDEGDATADAGACAIIVGVMGTAAVQTACVNTESAMIDIVERALHAAPAEWLFFRELRVGTGRRNERSASTYSLSTRCRTPP